MQTIELTSTCVCVSHDTQLREYVIYTGNIAGITDTLNLESNPETLNRRTDEIKFDGNRIHR
jgi:hypothetical protein